MNVAELISRYRIEILDDNIEPYLWSNAECVNHLNDTIDELMEENLLTVDQTTTATVQIKLLSDTTLYALSDYILKVRHARLNSTGFPLKIITEDWLNANVSDWRTTTGEDVVYVAPSAAKGYLSIFPKYDTTGSYTGTSDISFVASTKTISQVGGDFSALTAADSVNVDVTTSNDGYFTVATAGTTSFTVSEDLVDEDSTSAVIKLVRDTMIMTVNRLPLTAFSTTDITAATTITEPKALHHSKLFNGMAKRAYLKPDSETYDKTKAEYHRQLFEKDKKAIRRSLILLNKPDKALTIRSGTGIGY